jgi:hypothetical protein
MQKESKLKSKIGKILLIILLLAVGIVGGFFGGESIGRHIVESGNEKSLIPIIVLFLLLLYLAAFIQIIVHETGHLIFGKLSGYQFVSFRIGSFMFVSDQGKFKVKRFRLKGTGGQCLLMPPKPDNDYRYPFTMYNLGGVLANLTISLLCILISILLPMNYYVNMFFMIMFILGIFFTLMNGIPMRIGGIANDGFNLQSIKNEGEARRAFWLILMTNALISEGNRLRDMPSEWFEFDKSINLNNTMLCSIGVLRCSYLEDLKLFDQARELCEFLVTHSDGILTMQKNELRCELMFYEIIGLCREEEVEKIYSNDLKKYIKITSSYISRRRLLYAYELLVKNDPLKAGKQLEAFEKISKTFPYKSEIESERERLSLIKEKADNRRNI